MKATALNALIARVDAAEYRICRRLNRGIALTPLRALFIVASRLGDGVVWYVLLVALPLVHGGAYMEIGRASCRERV